MLKAGQYVFSKEGKPEFWFEKTDQSLFSLCPLDIFFRNQLQEIELWGFLDLSLHITGAGARVLALALRFFTAFAVFP